MPRVTAKGDGLTLLVPAIGVAAIASLKVGQGQMARIDFDTAEFWHFFALPNRHRPHELGNVAFARSFKTRPRRDRRRGGKVIRPVGRSGKLHPLGAADRGAAGIGGAEFRVERPRGLRKGHTPGKIIVQRLRMLGGPV